VIPAQRYSAPPCQIVANAAFLERLQIALKVLTHPLKDLLGSDSCPVSLLSVILGPLVLLVIVLVLDTAYFLPAFSNYL
jgi:hypothetical protein